jgi:hypothetical protein
MMNRFDDPTVFDARNQFNSSKTRAAPTPKPRGGELTMSEAKEDRWTLFVF